MRQSVNEVELVYNEWSQITEDRQAHAGAAGGSTPKVAYQYENGSANHVRLKKITHPDGNNVVDLLYGTGGGQDDQLSRLKQVTRVKANSRMKYMMAQSLS